MKANGEVRRHSAIVTGGARGIGAAISRELSKQGYAVLIADILDDDGEKLAAELGAAALYQHLDVTSAADWELAISAAVSELGPLSVLINNAGILDFAGIEAETVDNFRHVLDVNLVGSWLGMHFAAPALRAAGGGVIVNISSTAGLQGYSGIAAYVASKWALRGLTKAAALELGSDSIRVCSVHPGPIHTPMTASLAESMAAGQPLARFGEPAEVAALVRFIVTEATYSTGCEFVTDGGATAGAVLNA